jgi:hypothetical protein
MTALGLIFLGNNDDEIPRATVNFFFTFYDECPCSIPQQVANRKLLWSLYYIVFSGEIIFIM